MRISTLISCLKGKSLLLFMAAMSVITACSEKKTFDCSHLKNGVFVFHPRGDKDGYIISREGGFQKEVVEGNTDTSFFKIDWKDDCSYKLSYLRGGDHPEELKEMMLKETVITNILGVSKDYYLINVNVNGSLLEETVIPDTIWLRK